MPVLDFGQYEGFNKTCLEGAFVGFLCTGIYLLIYF